MVINVVKVVFFKGLRVSNIGSNGLGIDCSKIVVFRVVEDNCF